MYKGGRKIKIKKKKIRILKWKWTINWLINELVLLVLCKGFQRSHLKIVNVDVDVDVVVVLCVYRNWSSKSKILHCLASSIFINIGCVFWVCLGRAEGGREAWMRKRKEIIPFHSIASFFSIVHSFNYDSSRRKKKNSDVDHVPILWNIPFWESQLQWLTW